MSEFTQRLQDPNETVSPKDLAEMQSKISMCLTKLFQDPKTGGNPFLYALAMSKPHYLANDLAGMEFKTAATNGKMYYWHGPFLKLLDVNQSATVMMHESLHIAFWHPERMRDKEPDIANISMDYIVNAVIEKDHQDTGRHQSYRLWGGALGEPLDFATYLGFIDGKHEMPKHQVVFADVTLFNRSPESVYDEIWEHWEKSPRKCKKCKALSLDPKTGRSVIPKPWGADCCQACGAKPNDRMGGSSMDSHIPSSATRQEVMSDLMKAAQSVKAMGRGTLPAGIADVLKELEEPTLQLNQIIRHCFFRKQVNAGNQNDWSRFNRRFLAMDPPIFVPKKKRHSPRFLWLQDTSGSMGERDMANCLKEAKLAVRAGGEGVFVPMDAQAYWDKKMDIKRLEDLKAAPMHGRGGTAFATVFEQLPKEVGIDWDVIVVGTDGFIDDIPLSLAPPCDVLWIISADNPNFKPNFGRVVNINPVRH